MSLTLPSNYSSAAKSGNIQENWIVQLGFYNGDTHGSGEGGWKAALQTGGNANLINNLGSDIVQSGSNTNPTGSNWTRRDADGNIDGWTAANPSAYEDDETASLINALSAAMEADKYYLLTFTVGVAILSLEIGGGDLSGNTSDESLIAATSYAVSEHQVTVQPSSDRSHLWFTANTTSGGNGTIARVSLIETGYGSTVTEIIVDDGTVFSSGDFIKIDSEILEITVQDGNTLTVRRGMMGTTAAGHLNNTAIYWNNFAPISMSNTVVDDVFYHGVITNVPSVRTSINLAKSTAQSGNISLNVANFQYKSDDFSAELFLGTRKYINREVRIYSQLNGEATLSNCLQVYSGRLINILHDDSTVILQLTEQRPWDFISIPQDKSSNNIYEPVVYGDYTDNANPSFCNGSTLYPLPIVGTLDNELLFAQAQSVGSGHESHYYDSQLDRFVTVNSEDTATSSFNSLDCIGVPTEVSKTVRIRPTVVAATDGFADTADAINGSASDGATASATVTSSETGSDSSPVYGTQTDTDTIDFKVPEVDGEITSLKINILGTIVSSSTATGNDSGTLPSCKIQSNLYSTLSDILTRQSASNGTTSTSGTSINLTDGSGSGTTSAYSQGSELVSNYNATKKLDQLKIQALYSSGTGDQFGSVGYGGENGYQATFAVTISDVILEITYQNDIANEPTASYAKNSQLDRIYSGTDGLTNSFTGGSGAVTTGLQAHRDLLFRFTGFDDTDANIYNYDANLDIEDKRIDSAADEDNWDIRWWALEPIELRKVLERIQYEFGFIFKWRHDGMGSYWFIKDSYSSGDEAQTFTKNDINNLRITNTPFSELITQMEISYEKHPAENKYLSSQTSKDTTNDPRTKWNIQSKENILEVKLDMNVNKQGNTNPGGGNSNDGFADYYMNIFGDIKKIISCSIVNPAKGYNLETGDVIQFSNTAGEMAVEPFGDNWADYYMITGLKRSPGKIQIECREVG